MELQLFNFEKYLFQTCFARTSSIYTRLDNFVDYAVNVNIFEIMTVTWTGLSVPSVLCCCSGHSEGGPFRDAGRREWLQPGRARQPLLWTGTRPPDRHQISVTARAHLRGARDGRARKTPLAHIQVSQSRQQTNRITQRFFNPLVKLAMTSPLVHGQQGPPMGVPMPFQGLEGCKPFCASKYLV